MDQIMTHKWFKKFGLSFVQKEIELEESNKVLDSVLVTNNDPFMEFMNSGRDDDELER